MSPPVSKQHSPSRKWGSIRPRPKRVFKGRNPLFGQRVENRFANRFAHTNAEKVNMSPDSPPVNTTSPKSKVGEYHQTQQQIQFPHFFRSIYVLLATRPFFILSARSALTRKKKLSPPFLSRAGLSRHGLVEASFELGFNLPVQTGRDLNMSSQLCAIRCRFRLYLRNTLERSVYPSQA